MLRLKYSQFAHVAWWAPVVATCANSPTLVCLVMAEGEYFLDYLRVNGAFKRREELGLESTTSPPD